MSGPLTGLKVVEMAAIGPVPLAGQLLADLGAEVIIIDRKSARQDDSDINRRNKKSIAVNLKTADGLAVAKKLINNVDILLEGFRPGVMEKLGLGPADCHNDNPGLIYGRMTGWGQQGPLSHSAGHDINYLALTGALHAIGLKNQPPIPPLNLAADYGGGSMFLIFGVLAAVYERQQSALGQVVDAAMIDGVPAMMSLIHALSAKDRWLPQRQSNLLDGGAPFYRCYETADGKHIAVGALEPQFFAQLVATAGLPNEQLQQQNNPTHWPAMHEHYARIFKTRSRDEWQQLFDGTDACVAPVLNFDEAAAHHHNIARDGFFRHNGILQASPAPRFDRTPASPPCAPVGAGASTTSVLSELGYSSAEIAKLSAANNIT